MVGSIPRRKENEMEKQIFRTRLVTETSDEDLEGVGTLRWVGDSLFRWVQNTEAAAMTVGMIAFYESTATAADVFKTVTKCDTADLGMMAGVIMAASLADDDYGWIQVLGFCASVSVLNATGTSYAVGYYMKGVNGNAYLSADAATQPLYNRNIQLMEVAISATTSTTLYGGLVNCL